MKAHDLWHTRYVQTRLSSQASLGPILPTFYELLLPGEVLSKVEYFKVDKHF